MNSSTTLYLLIPITILILIFVHYSSARLRRKFPSLPVWRGVLWYRWKSQPSADALAFSPFTGVIFPHKIQVRAKSAWLCFMLHLIFMFLMILWSKYSFDKEQESCPKPTPPSSCGWSNNLELNNYIMISGTFVFIFLRIFQTHVWYDGLALDVPEASSMAAVIVSLSLSCLMQQTERGLIFGFSLTSETVLVLTSIARRYHGYVHAFTVVFTFWYHPTEGGMLHLPGFFMILLLLFQGCLMFTISHLNILWRVVLEMLVLPHTLLVEKHRTHRDLWKMFVSGYIILFLMSQMHALCISFLIKSCLFLASGIVLYCMYSHSLRAFLAESLRIPVTYYLFIIIFYISLFIPYSILSLFGYWPKSQVVGTLPQDSHHSLTICAVILLFTAIVLIGLIGEFFEMKLRSLAIKAGPANNNIKNMFQAPEKKIEIQKTNLPQITFEELKKHNHLEDYWVAIHGIVYDVTEFVKFHPGGSSILVQHCGGDGSKGFDAVRGEQGHPRLIRERMKSLACAVIKKKSFE